MVEKGIDPVSQKVVGFPFLRWLAALRATFTPSEAPAGLLPAFSATL
jgi:hypothetical protein